MTQTIGRRQDLYRLLNGAQRELQTLFAGLSERVALLVYNAANADGVIPPERGRDLRVAVGSAVDAVFTGTLPGQRGRFAFGTDGVTPLADYPRLLNTWIVKAVQVAVAPHARYMQRVVPEDVQAQWGRLPVRVSEQDGGSTTARLVNVLFRPNPLAWYEPAHTWVDPNGYRLSDRIWNTDQAVRLKLDRVLAQMINEGRGSREIANSVTRFLNPGRSAITTTRPYGTRVSYDAMRLARTEITRAHSAATKASALANPYVVEMDWNLSASHPKVDICDALAAGSPYPKESAPIPVVDSHPQCICYATARTAGMNVDITEQLRTDLAGAEAHYQRVHPTPLQQEDFLSLLLGTALFEWGRRSQAALVGESSYAALYD